MIHRGIGRIMAIEVILAKRKKQSKDQLKRENGRKYSKL